VIKTYTRWINPKKLDELLYALREIGIDVWRHSYSYRLIYKNKIIASLHIYPGYNDVTIRILGISKETAMSVMDHVLTKIREVLPYYRIHVKTIEPKIKIV